MIRMRNVLSTLVVVVVTIAIVAAFEPDFSKRKVGQARATVGSGSIRAGHDNSRANRVANLEARSGRASIDGPKKALKANRVAGSSADASVGSKSVKATKNNQGSNAEAKKGSASFKKTSDPSESEFGANGKKSFDGRMHKVPGQQQRRIVVKNNQNNKKTKYQVKKDGEDGIARALDHKKVAKIDQLKKGSQTHVLYYGEEGEERQADKTVAVQKQTDGWNGIVPINLKGGAKTFLPPNFIQGNALVGGRKSKTNNQVVSDTFLLPKVGFLGQVPDFDTSKAASKGQSAAKTDNTAYVGTVKNSKKEAKPIWQTKFDRGTEVECEGDFDNQNDKKSGGFKYENLKVQYAGKDGSQYDFPGCFDITADVTIPAGFSMKDIALSLFVFSPACGQLKCGAESACNGIDCFLEDVCRAQLAPGGGAQSFNDFGNWALSKTTSDACERPVSSSATTAPLAVRYCPDQEATTSFKQACDVSILGGIPKAANKKKSVVVQANVFEKREGFECQVGLLGNSKNVGFGDTLVKRACKEYHVDFGYTRKSYKKGDQYSNPSCRGKGANHPLCVGLGNRR